MKTIEILIESEELQFFHKCIKNFKSSLSIINTIEIDKDTIEITILFEEPTDLYYLGKYVQIIKTSIHFNHFKPLAQ
jgi:hypothetical protein